MRKLYTIFLSAVLLSTVVYAAKKFPLTASTSVPAAKGEVEVDKDKNGNVRVNLKAEHLASPDNLTPPSTVYVVWVQDRGGDPENKGQLKVSKKLEASFETVTPSKNFDIFVTAERDSGIKTPSGTEVLRASIQQ